MRYNVEPAVQSLSHLPDLREKLTAIPHALAALLSVLSDLHILSISDTKRLYSSQATLALLEYVFCPSLRQFRLDVHSDLAPNLPSFNFLERHPRLTHLTLRIDRLSYTPVSTHRDEPLRLLNLEHFEGPSEYLQYLSSDTTPLRSVSMDLTLVSGGIGMVTQRSWLERDLSGLRSFPSLRALTIMQETHGIDSIGIVAAHLPMLEELEIRHKSYSNRLPVSRVRLLYVLGSHPALHLNFP